MKTKRGTAHPDQPAGGGKQAKRTGRKAVRQSRSADQRRDGKLRREAPEATGRRETRRRVEGQPRGRARDPRALQHGPATTPVRRPGRPKNTSQAKARAKARKAKAPKVVRVPLRERLLTRISSIDLNPRSLVARVPFVVLVIGALGVGLGVTLWLSTDAAERSYQLGNARQTNQALMQQKEALERDVLEAQAAPALAEAARNLGMIPSRDTAHLIQDPAGNWVVVGNPKPAEGVPPPPLNTPLPDVNPAPVARPAAPDPAERSVVVPSPQAPAPVLAAPQVLPAGPAPEPPAAASLPEVPAPRVAVPPAPLTAVPNPEALVHEPAPAAGPAPTEPAPAVAPPAAEPAGPPRGALPGPALPLAAEPEAAAVPGPQPAVTP